MLVSLPFKLFIIYAREDRPALLELKAHLRPLENRGDLTVWYDGEILPGQDWDKAIKNQLATADIVLLFISKHFFSSEYIEKEELKKALERHKKGELVIIPVIVRPCYWEADPKIKGFQALPKDAKPVSIWDDSDEAWTNVAHNLLEIIEQRGYNSDHETTVQKLFESDGKNILQDFEKGSSIIKKDFFVPTYESIESLSYRVLKQIEDTSKKITLYGVPSGFVELDRLTSGWQRSDLIILAGRPSMGKSSMMLNLALNASQDFNKSVFLLSLEMNSKQIMNRLISMEAEIGGSTILSGKLEDYEWQQLQTTIERLNSTTIYIDDTPGINIVELRAKCRELLTQHDIQLIIIDNL